MEWTKPIFEVIFKCEINCLSRKEALSNGSRVSPPERGESLLPVDSTDAIPRTSILILRSHGLNDVLHLQKDLDTLDGSIVAL
jgi:hypothetical protein